MEKNRLGLLFIILGLLILILPDIFILSGDFSAIGRISNKMALYRIIALLVLSVPLFMKVSWMRFVFGIYSIFLLMVAIMTITDNSVVYASAFKTRWIIFAFLEAISVYVFLIDRKVRSYLKD